MNFSLLRGWLPPSLAISRRVIPVTGKHSHNWQIHCAVSALPSPYLGQQWGEEHHTLLTSGSRKRLWVNQSDSDPLPWHSLCSTVSFGIRQAVWMGCHRHQETAGKKVKSETEKAVIGSGLSCIHVVWGRQLMLHFRWQWMLHLAMDALTFLLRTCVCSQWRFNRFFSPWSCVQIFICDCTSQDTDLSQNSFALRTLLYLFFMNGMEGKKMIINPSHLLLEWTTLGLVPALYTQRQLFEHQHSHSYLKLFWSQNTNKLLAVAQVPGTSLRRWTFCLTLRSTVWQLSCRVARGTCSSSTRLGSSTLQNHHCCPG